MGLFSRKQPFAMTDVSEHVVVARFRLAPGPRGTATNLHNVYALEEQLASAIESAGAGEFEPPQFGRDETGHNELVLSAYGPDANRLFAAMEPALRSFPARPASVLLRFGAFDDPNAAEQLVRL
ncbi:hypothetical protein [Cryptosporangium aurantiacum]|uniref:DUF695 domain-containing protein n=1 Tax=Cryptosporangium aurantiacum TaxID=134849 RepID=A0A1M7QMI2_9ACTN|nr:hypothetical protein [Cryptosporangium aurantiacum]SHN32669.1 hypothetical protein SAMN05443668_10564 [Cryptosporangium aurantiacum]